jgi:hypothetical protein
MLMSKFIQIPTTPRIGGRRWLIGLALASVFLVQPVVRASVLTIDGKTGPWAYTIGGLNTTFQYGVNDFLAPVLFSSLTAGQQVRVTYLSGTVNGGPGAGPPVNAYVDANGVLSYTNPDQYPHSNGHYASFYMSGTIAYAQLVGTFANSQGAIVGNPFGLGNGPITLTVPAGATRLQLGMNDNAYSDNVGSWSVDVQVVPEPTVLSCLLIGVPALFLRRAIRRRQ